MVSLTGKASSSAADKSAQGSGPPKFSVVIPTFNRAGLIGTTLDSVFAQTYPAHEVIVVDNCSTDRTTEAVRQHPAASHIRLIEHAHNLERAVARNTGMEQATGDFVTFLDSDDLMYEQNLRDAAVFVSSDPTWRIFHNLYELVDPMRRVLHRYRFPPLHDFRRAIIEGNFLSCIGVFLHREVYRAYRFDTSPVLVGSEDWDLWIRILARYRVGRIAQVNSGIVHHDGRTVRSVDFHQLEQRMNYLANKLGANPDLQQAYAHHVDRFVANALVYQATMANADGRFNEARRYLRRAVAAHAPVIASLKFVRVLQLAVQQRQTET